MGAYAVKDRRQDHILRAAHLQALAELAAAMDTDAATMRAQRKAQHTERIAALLMARLGLRVAA